MHKIVEEHPRVAALDEQLAALRVAEARHGERVAAAAAGYRIAEEAWAEEANAAVLAGEPPPPQPEEPDLGADRGAPIRFASERQRLANERLQALASLVPELELLLTEAEGTALAEIARLAKDMEPHLAELRALLGAAHQLRDAEATCAAQRVRPSRGDRTRTSIDIADVIEAATTGGSLLEPAPIRPPRSEDGRVQVVGPTEPEPRLGLQPKRAFGQPPEDPPRTSRGRTVVYI